MLLFFLQGLQQLVKGRLLTAIKTTQRFKMNIILTSQKCVRPKKQSFSNILRVRNYVFVLFLLLGKSGKLVWTGSQQAINTIIQK